MAFYEMLPGAGMPPGLQAGMDSILNKKFGTSTTYPAEGWPDTVNLMGPLPEKTASGAIVTFPDGADAVPLKKCEVSLPASLDGYSSVDVVSAGKNLFNVADYSQIYTDRDGVDSYNYRYMIIHLKPNTTYTVSQNSGEAKSTPIVLINSVLPVGGSNYLDLRTASGSKTYTTGDDGYLYIGSVNSYDDVVYARLQECNIQLEAGSTATTYEPYTTPTTYTASLGRTIYGGTADVVAGQGAEEYGIVDLGNLTWTKRNTSSGHWRFTTQDIPIIINDDNSHIPDIVSVDYTAISPTQSYNGITGITCNTNISQLMICDESYSDAGAFTTAMSGKYIVYPLIEASQTGVTFDPVPIDSKSGNNTIWSEQGDNTEVTYRADINLALGGN